MLRDFPEPLFNFPPPPPLVRVPDKSGIGLKPLCTRPPPQQRFIADCGFYVAQAREEGPEAEEQFLKTFLDSFYERWPEVKKIHEGTVFFTADHEARMLARELGWAATWSSQIVPSLHWEKAFKLDRNTWEIEAAKNRQHLERCKQASASASSKVSQPSSPAVSSSAGRPVPKRLPKNVRPSKPPPGATPQTAIDIDMLDDSNIEQSLKELEEGLIIKGPPPKRKCLVPRDVTFF
ncbi:hypothetical protein EST38_g4771 [Candolleomyces aberdarensis]|uniref:Uncharacterized protein n=1 Tax=Candolleomyces aberdarensis TaxID=2316362 RepID=A0A4Q2DPJ3_9AGAR|nr:hypothetical protein EST38_g4771 [Candolleomyces aberdarensis]